MYFRTYSSNKDTLKEWAKQLNIVNKGYFPLYDTESKTLSHWKNILNQNLNTNTFDIRGDVDLTLNIWKEKLNNIYNK